MYTGTDGPRFWAPAVAGLIAASTAVIAGGRTMTPTTVPDSSWFGLAAVHGPNTSAGVGYGLVLFVALIALVVLWIATVHAAARGHLSERRVWSLGAIWAAPFLAGPPIISKDVHAFVAQGILASRGQDPYSVTVRALHRLQLASADRALAAVDPRWRSSLSPYGPLATWLERCAADITGGNPTGAVIVLRAMAVLSVIAMSVTAAALGRPPRARSVACVLLCPLVLVHAVSGAHFEAEMAALVMAGILAADRRRWTWAVVLLCAAGSVKAPAFAVLPLVVAAHVRCPDHSGRALTTVVRDTLVAAVCIVSAALTVPDGFGWVRNLSTPAQSATSSVAGLLTHGVRLVTPGPWATGVRTAVAGALLLIAAALVLRLVTHGQGRAVAASAGSALVAIALLAPVFYPWYLLWGVLCWVVAARPARGDQLLALCGVATVLGATGTPVLISRPVDLLALAVAAVWIRRSSVRSSENGQGPPDVARRRAIDGPQSSSRAPQT